MAEAEKLAKHLGYVYNTFGLIVKDFVSLMGYRFRSEQALQGDRNKKDRKLVNPQTMTEKKVRSMSQMEEELLEGKYNGAPPNRVIK